MKILWLASWYPNPQDPFEGDFTQRHARAASLHNDIYVIYVTPDKAGRVTNNIKEETRQDQRLTEHITYFKASSSLFGRVSAFLKWRKFFKEAIIKYINQQGRPDLVHLHVGVRAGLLALWMKKKYDIPFVLTEHWAGFSLEAKENFASLPFYVRVLWKRAVKGAIAISSVSRYLGELLKKQFGISDYTLIPNVVDTRVFYPVNTKSSNDTRFIHISTLGHQKNPEAMLQAFELVKKTHTNFHVDIFGPTNKSLLKLVDELQLEQHVYFHQEIPQPQLATFMAQADALILYSRYESFGCVIIEANACGIPVMVSDLPVFHETVKQGVNGVFVKAADFKSLAECIKSFIGRKYLFDKMNIAALTASKYSYNVVGKQFSDWYEYVLKSLH